MSSDRAADRQLEAILRKRQLEIAAPPKTHVRSAQEQAEYEAAEAFAEGIRCGGESIRGFARRVGKDESLIRAYMTGAKGVPLAMLKRLTPAGQFAALRACIKTVPETAEIVAADAEESSEDKERRTA